MDFGAVSVDGGSSVQAKLNNEKLTKQVDDSLIRQKIKEQKAPPKPKKVAMNIPKFNESAIKKMNQLAVEDKNKEEKAKMLKIQGIALDYLDTFKKEFPLMTKIPKPDNTLVGWKAYLKELQKIINMQGRDENCKQYWHFLATFIDYLATNFKEYLVNPLDGRPAELQGVGEALQSEEFYQQNIRNFKELVILYPDFFVDSLFTRFARSIAHTMIRVDFENKYKKNSIRPTDTPSAQEENSNKSKKKTSSKHTSSK